MTGEPPEDDTHEAVAKAMTMLLLPPAMWACYPAGHIKLPADAAAKLARRGLRRGFPDFLFWHAGRAFGIELKAEGGELSRTYLVRTARGGLVQRMGQRDVFPRLEEAGMTIAVCKGVPEVLATLRGWGIPVRNHAIMA